MSQPIIIPLEGVIQEFLLDDEETKSLSRYVLRNISDEYYRKWEGLAMDTLHSTRIEYLTAMFVYSNIEGTCMTFGMSPRQSKLGFMREEGASPWDIKTGMENSQKKHMKKDGSGWYITVPFRHATSEAVAESMIFSDKMPKEVEQLVKTTGRPLNLADLETVDLMYRGESRRGDVRYIHKNAIYEGLKRTDISSTNKENRGGYFTFRRISDKSDPNSWSHPGFEPLKLMEKALQEVNFDTLADIAIDQFLTAKYDKQ